MLRAALSAGAAPSPAATRSARRLRFADKSIDPARLMHDIPVGGRISRIGGFVFHFSTCAGSDISGHFRTCSPADGSRPIGAPVRNPPLMYGPAGRKFGAARQRRDEIQPQRHKGTKERMRSPTNLTNRTNQHQKARFVKIRAIPATQASCGSILFFVPFVPLWFSEFRSTRPRTACSTFRRR